MRVHLTFLSIGIVFFLLASASERGVARAMDPAGTLYFVACDTGGCHCIEEKSIFIGRSLQSLQSAEPELFERITLKKIDFFDNRAYADSIMNAHGLDFIPALILVNRGNRDYYKVSYDFDTHQISVLQEKLRELVRDNEKGKPVKE